jgi:hypothetical protein
MKRITSNLLLLLAAVLVMAASCKKDDPKPGPDEPETTRQDQISKTWKVSAILINNAPAAGVDFSSYSFEFKKSGSYDIEAGTLSGTGKWELNSNEEKLILDKGTDTQKTADILSLTDSKLELEFTEASGKTGEQKVLFKLKQ